MSLKLNLRALYYREDFKKNWYEIRNCKILIGTLKKVIKFIDNPTYKQLEYVKFLANEFDYSEKIYFYIVFLVFLLVHFVRMIIFTLLFLQWLRRWKKVLLILRILILISLTSLFDIRLFSILKQRKIPVYLIFYLIIFIIFCVFVFIRFISFNFSNSFPRYIIIKLIVWSSLEVRKNIESYKTSINGWI